MDVRVFSVFMNNISTKMLEKQEECVKRVLPDGWKFNQIMTKLSHGQALDEIVSLSNADIFIFLDIDCIPLTQLGFNYLVKNVMQDSIRGEDQGLAGAVQRANHINNDKHLYVGPFCMAFSKRHYEELGSPSFVETSHGDVGEELTYRWSEKSGQLCSVGRQIQKYSNNIHFMWPSSTSKPLWDLDFGWKFGIGTTYGAAPDGAYLFYHSFNARDPKTEDLFIFECNKMLSAHRRTA